MSDPLSITGSAVGVISLGLVVCGEIISYGRAFGDYGEDIRNMTIKAESVCVPLKALREIIGETRMTHPDTATDLSKKAMDITMSVERLQGILERYRPRASSDLPGKAKNQLKRAVYHFRKETLRDMGTELNSMQNILQTSLAVYQWKDTIRISQEIQKMQSTLKNGMLPPSLLKSMCDIHNKRQLDMMNDNYASLPGRKERYPRCQKVLQKSYTLYSRWLGLMVTASLNISTGAGGLSFSPSLDIEAIVDLSNEIIHFVEFGVIQATDPAMALEMLQNQFSSKRFHPFLLVRSAISEPHSLIDMILVLSSRNLQAIENLIIVIEFLLDVGVRPHAYLGGRSSHVLNAYPLEKRHMPFFARLATLGFRFNLDFALTACAKRNLQLILSASDEYLVIPMSEGTKIVLLEKEEEFKKGLRQQKILPNEKIYDSTLFPEISLLELAVGWAEGVNILLKFGADAEQYFESIVYPGLGYHHSAELLLRAGCFLSVDNLNACCFYDGNEERMMLFVKEMAKRRKALLRMAEAQLPSGMISTTNTNTVGSGLSGESLLDGPRCFELYEKLNSAGDRGYTMSKELQIPAREFFFPFRQKYTGSSWKEWEFQGATVYHGLYRWQCADALYNIGFREIDLLDSRGRSPLGSLVNSSSFGVFNSRDWIEITRWHVSKGSNIFQLLPWANEPVGYLLPVRFIDYLFCHPSPFNYPDYYAQFERQVEKGLQGLDDVSPQIFSLPNTMSDKCSCLCSPNGCTAVSAILREFTGMIDTPRNRLRISSNIAYSNSCRRFFNRLYEWDQSCWKSSQAFIRSLTFNALDLTHSCFESTVKGNVLLRNMHWPNNKDIYVNENCDPQSSIDEFESLVTDLELEFNQLRLPLKEFLEKHWYRRVRDHLLTPQKSQYQHIADARNMGVELEFCGLFVPLWMDILFAPRWQLCRRLVLTRTEVIHGLNYNFR